MTMPWNEKRLLVELAHVCVAMLATGVASLAEKMLVAFVAILQAVGNLAVAARGTYAERPQPS